MKYQAFFQPFPGEMVHQLSITKPKVVITIPQAHNTVAKALQDAKIEARTVIVVDPNSSVPNGTMRYSELAESGDADHSLLDKVEKNYDDLAILPFSSGTTGLPKGVQITYRNLLESIQLMMHEKFCLPSLPDRKCISLY